MNSSSSGLPSNNIYDIEFTSDSAIWIATDSGLAFFNWNSWTIYNSSNTGLITDVITEVSFSKDGTMWVGCSTNELFNDSTGGLNRFRDSVWTAFTPHNSDLFDPHITEIVSFGYDSLLIWSYPPEIPEQFGLMQFFDGSNWININDTSMIYSVYTVLDFEVINEIGYAAMGMDGLAILEDTVWQINNIHNSNIPGQPIQSVTSDDTSNVWMIIESASSSPIYRYDGGNYQNYPHFPLPNAIITSFEVDSKGNFWLGTRMDGMIKIGGNEFTFYDTSNSPLATNNVVILAKDLEVRIWLWNWQQPGIVIFDPDTITSVENQIAENQTPNRFRLYQNYPNPFNPNTKIKFTIPSVADANFVSATINIQLKVYDVLGSEVATLMNENKAPGTYETEFDAKNFSSGIYFVKLSAGFYQDIIKINLIR
ncbi:MAG: T9SS type A sorting domain-containing protein [Ignavibacteria bacterium]|nr:T9SS type A sorting domain-containing protein [Ignavibacteria bacterium]